MINDPFTSALPEDIDVERQLAECLAEFRRLGNLSAVDVREMAKCHSRADRLLAKFPELDNPNERYCAPHRVAHRQFISRLFERN